MSPSWSASSLSSSTVQRTSSFDKEKNVRASPDFAAYDIFFIAKGDNFVSIKDTQKEEEGYKNFKKLVPGDHFGVHFSLTLWQEISVIYQCPRSATIMSNNYCTYARLPFENYK